MLSNLKKIILQNIVALVRRNTPLEQILCYLCANPFLRKQLKFGAIAHHYISSFDRPELRLAPLERYKMWVNIAEYQGLFLYFFREHQEPWSTFLASQFIQEGDVCIDVGANMGSYTFFMASKVGDRGRVFAFEPQPDLYQMLVDSIHLNKIDDFVIADRRALHSKSGEMLKIHLSEDVRNSGLSSVLVRGEFLRESNFIEAETVALDDFFERNQIDQCQLIKIDIEGAETEAIEGMLELLKAERIHYLIVEQHAGSDAQKILNSLGYHCWFIDESQQKLLDQTGVTQECFGNYFFVSQHHLEHFKHCYSHWIEPCSQTSL
jgi:FkbM family methyltransferase